ncbi:FAD-dependent oxidoreductase [Bacteroides finegoldii]|uniref:FAD-dependent oxidoreductase n=1 Tax=Bacteroides finegoldii TaxID=338188 RepID=UPI0022E83034|nr:FAD-dependent oxidoreductase [Bacteroides finegoldii]
MRKIILLLLGFTLFTGCKSTPTEEYDICIYGGTSAGVIAAYSAKMMNKKVLLIEPQNRLGGLTSGGLGFTDIGNKQVVTGLSKDFYRRLGTHYGKLEQWIFEPKVADSIFNDYVKRADIDVLYKHRIIEANVIDGTIRDIILESSDGTKTTKTVFAKMFIDCTYEGDLMAKAGVSYTIGREDNKLYNETYNGVQLMKGHQFPDGIDPYKIPGDSTSGLLWGIAPTTLSPEGTGDKLVQAYNYRICLTNNPTNKIEITKPDNYDPAKYELLLRLFDAQPEKRKLNHYFIWSRMPNKKTDINNRGGFSTDMIGMNHNYPEASYKEREKIIKTHKDYTQGLLYFYKTDPRVPKELKDEIQEWGYPKDEYTENHHWSPQLYIRESRRMIGDYVMTQAHCEGHEIVDDGIGMAAYTMDSHNCQRIVIKKDGKHFVKNEGNVEIGGGLPYPISYRSIIPKDNECKNLLVPVCLSASHIAYGSIRMEPVFMVLAQSAAIAATEAIHTGSVQSVNVKKVQAILHEDPLLDGSFSEILIDDSDLDLPSNNDWEVLKKQGGYGPSFLKLKNQNGQPIRFTPNIEHEGKYKVYTYYHMRKDIAPTITYFISNGTDNWTKRINKDSVKIEGQTSGEWIELGIYDFHKNTKSYIEISAGNTNGIVIADAVLFIPIK